MTTAWLLCGQPQTTATGLFAHNEYHAFSCIFRCGNVASILQFTDADNRTPKLFEAVPDDKRVIPARQVHLERTFIAESKEIIWVISGDALLPLKREVGHELSLEEARVPKENYLVRPNVLCLASTTEIL